MTAPHLVALVLLVAGTAVLVVSAVALPVLPAPYTRLHALAPATSLGLPLLCLAAAVETGPGRQAVKLLCIALIAAAAGPVTAIAMGRALHRTERRTGSEEDA
ncbi:cation:proton antiporter [Streptomyces sp. NPDC059740]|uniref:cation:proton antiporter n=1 Tax=Streptomyces sp. NPDC059740 TaxID=3346926 RepID=UPI003647DD1B